MKYDKYGISTKAIHAGAEPDPATGAIMTPIYATSTFVQSSPGVHKGYEYSRSGNPTRAALEKCIAELEEGVAGFAFSSGLAASSAVLELIGKDAHIISSNDLYGGTYRLFEKVKKISTSLEVTYIDLSDIELLKNSIRPDTRMIWVETPTNPLLKIFDLKKISEIAKERKILTVCDNTFATPYIQRPLTLEFDIAIHSATKYLNGHSDVVAGVAIAKDPEIAEKIKFFQNAIGSILSPFDSFLVLRGLKTLALRMRTHSENAMKIAEYLEKHEKIEKVIYPGLKSHPDYELAKEQMSAFGGMISFFIKGGEREAVQFLERTKLFSLAESLGGVESLIEHPAIMTHASIPKDQREAIGITDNLIRISVGVEDASDLIDDLDNALSSVHFNEIFDEWAENYDETVSSNEGEYAEVFENYDKILKTVVDRIEQPENSLIVDVGAGTGNLAHETFKRGYKVVAVEPNKNMRSKIYEKHKEIYCVEGDFLNVPMPLNSLAGIVCSYAFHHLTEEEKQKAAHNFYKLLTDTGVVVIADTMYEKEEDKKNIIDEAQKKGYMSLADDLKREFYTTHEKMKKYFESAGFKVSFESMNKFVWIMHAKK